MTVLDPVAPIDETPSIAHPLSSLTAGEIVRVRDLVTAKPDFTPTTRFAYVGLDEPHKHDVLA